MIRKPCDDSLVYALLVALEKGRTSLILNNFTISIRYREGKLSIISPYRIVLNRMFKLTDEVSSVVGEGLRVFNQTYIIDDNLDYLRNSYNDLKRHYELTYLLI